MLKLALPGTFRVRYPEFGARGTCRPGVADHVCVYGDSSFSFDVGFFLYDQEIHVWFFYFLIWHRCVQFCTVSSLTWGPLLGETLCAYLCCYFHTKVR